MKLVLSLFPGIDLLGRAFRQIGFCVVTGPDLIVGDDIRNFIGIPGRFDGIVGGPPCQGFSAANRQRTNASHKSVQNSYSMLGEFLRVASECSPMWFVCENVPGVPNIAVDGYSVQRLAITDWECGGQQIRTRHFQFGHKQGHIIRPHRKRPTRKSFGRKPTCAVASSEIRFTDQCKKQGVEPLVLPGWTKSAKNRAVGNAVPMPMGLTIAKAVQDASPKMSCDCPCGCGRTLKGKQKAATTSCRKTLQRMRECAIATVNVPATNVNDQA